MKRGTGETGTSMIGKSQGETEVSLPSRMNDAMKNRDRRTFLGLSHPKNMGSLRLSRVSPRVSPGFPCK